MNTVNWYFGPQSEVEYIFYTFYHFTVYTVYSGKPTLQSSSRSDLSVHRSELSWFTVSNWGLSSNHICEHIICHILNVIIRSLFWMSSQYSYLTWLLSRSDGQNLTLVRASASTPRCAVLLLYRGQPWFLFHLLKTHSFVLHVIQMTKMILCSVLKCWSSFWKLFLPFPHLRFTSFLISPNLSKMICTKTTWF